MVLRFVPDLWSINSAAASPGVVGAYRAVRAQDSPGLITLEHTRDVFLVLYVLN